MTRPLALKTNPLLGCRLLACIHQGQHKKLFIAPCNGKAHLQQRIKTQRKDDGTRGIVAVWRVRAIVPETVKKCPPSACHIARFQTVNRKMRTVLADIPLSRCRYPRE